MNDWQDPVVVPTPPPYDKLRTIDVSKKIEKKNGLSYLSWAFAVDTLLQADPLANWEYPQPTTYADGTVMVYCAVTAFGKRMQAHLPVMDHRNKPISNPDAFAMNTAWQRCLVKAIALHGIGLYIYAGEDLPAGSDAMGETKKVPPEALDNAVLEFRTAMGLDVEEEEKAAAVYAVHKRVNADEDLYKRVGEALNPTERRALHAYVSMHRKAMLDQPYTNGRARA
jgi:hypothetical protein